jgi:diguanylate cyclase (GGDEF)-like protein/PAS domain S-box-containing protein
VRGRITALALIAAMAAYVAAPLDAAGRTAVEGVAALFAASAIVWGVRAYRPPRREAWRSFAAGWALWGLGRLLNVVFPSMGAGTSTEVTLVDVPLLGGALFLVAGLFWLVAGDGHSGRKESAIDAGVITLAATLALWMLVIVEIVHEPALSGIDRVVSLAYPVTSLALLGTVVTLALAPRRRTPALWLVMAGIGAFLVSEVVSLAAIVGPALDGVPIQAAGLAGPLLVGAAALRPDLGFVGAPSERTEVGLSEGRLIALWLAALCSPMAFLALATTGNATRDHLATDLVLAAGVTAVMLSLVLWRLAGTVSHLGSTLVERDAASERELAVADIAARLARAERIQEVRDIVRSSGALLEADDASVDLWLPEDHPKDTSDSLLERDDEGELAPYLLRHPLYTDPAEGVLVIRSFEPIPSGVRSALSLVAGEVGLALERARLATELRRSERRFRSLVQHAPDAITVLARDGRITYASPAMGRILGVTEGALIGMTFQELLHPDEVAEVDGILATLAEHPEGTTLLERRVRRSDGGWRWIESRLTNLLGDRSVRGIVANHRDVTERKRLERQLEHQANHDALTGLANRRQLSQELAETDNADFDAMIFIDLDRFKDINDQLGHAVGDRLLATVAARIGANVRPGDLAARLGGDEFAVLLRDTSRQQAESIADRLLTTIREPMQIDGHDIDIDASVGVAVSEPGDGRTSRDLLHESDVAMYVAKREGRGRVAAFSPQMAEETLNRIELEAALRRALEREELRVLYQPVVDLVDGQTVGAEALLRWRHPTHGDIPPSEFIPVAERIGMIVPIGSWVLREACWQAKAMSTADRPMNMHVNVSTVQLREAGFVEDVLGVLTATGLQPTQLTLEITESVLVDDNPVTRDSIDQLRGEGVRLAIDDFGTGWSSLSYLRDVPVDVLKIDRSFVAGVGMGPEEAALARAILQLSHTFRLESVAEGIETESQRKELTLRGCTHGQGYLFAPPLPAQDFVDRVDREERQAAVAAGLEARTTRRLANPDELRPPATVGDTADGEPMPEAGSRAQAGTAAHGGPELAG